MISLSPQTAAISSAPSVLGKALEQGCNLAIWERPPLAGAPGLIEAVWQDIRFTTSLAGLAPILSQELTQKGYPDGPVREAFADDVQYLARLYSKTLDLDRISLRIEIVTTDSCRKWHADYVTARLITTYVGSGTDWIDGFDAARVRNGLAPKQIHSLKAGDVGLFRGKLSTEDPAIHRSPPIAGTGQKRLLLVLNPPDDI